MSENQRALIFGLVFSNLAEPYQKPHQILRCSSHLLNQNF